MNLRTKFHLASSCLVLTVVIGMMASLLLYEKKKLMADIEQQQMEELDKFARVCQDTMIVLDETALLNYAKNLVALSSPKLAYAGFVYPAQSGGSPWVWQLGGERISLLSDTDSKVLEIQASGTKRKINYALNGKRITQWSRPVDTERAPIKRLGYVRLGFSRDVIQEIFRETIAKTIKRFIIIGLIAIGFGLVLAQFFGAALSKPIKNLLVATESIAKGKRGIRIPEGGNDELGRLTKTFNHMSQELIKLDQLKEEFMSHVTHELRSPLTSIIATVELMSEMPIASKDAKMRRSIDRLMFGSERLNRLVDNILDLTRMEAGKMQFHLEPINIGTLLVEMADFFEPRAMEKGLKIQTIIPNRFPLVMADPERIRQVISNLIHNAIKFTNRGGIVLWLKEQDGLATIGVQDTGVGIPADKLGNVFSKFETLKDTRDRVEKPVPGSGLGLNIVQNSIKAQGGKIWVESEVDKGSTFIFQLPFATSQEKQPAVDATSDIAKAMTLPPSMAAARTPIAISQGKVI